MNISLTDALPLFTNEIVMKYSDHRKPKSFRRSMFTEVETASKLAAVVSQRGLKLAAGDLVRGTTGNLNVFDKSSEILTMGAFFDEFFNMVDLSSYDYLYVDGVMSKINFGKFLDDVASKMDFCMNKIDTSYERQCWELLTTGIVLLNNGQNLLSGRLGGSLVDLGNTFYWNQTGVDPRTTFLAGGNFLNDFGKMSGNVIDVIFGQNAFAAYKNNPLIIDAAKQVQWGVETIEKSMLNATGASYNGSSSEGGFIYRYWSYNDFYQLENGTIVKYMDTNKIIMLPEVKQNVLTYTAVPQLLTSGEQPTKGKFKVYDYINTKKTAHFLGVMSAGFPALGAVDQVYTAQVLAA